MSLESLFLRKDIEKLITCKEMAVAVKASEPILPRNREWDTNSPGSKGRMRCPLQDI